MARKVNLLKVLPARPEKCAGKTRYASQRDADTAAREQELLQAITQPDLHLTTYHCAFCGGWHLTSGK